MKIRKDSQVECPIPLEGEARFVRVWVESMLFCFLKSEEIAYRDIEIVLTNLEDNGQ